ncbi:RhoA GTPase effector DIA/Diaphanous [Rhizoctonia solani AG-1 IA]|uniref:RhoA GTPase effector DIA/Diaphanous n=1 Tax=Thanatephorus cucumeris (strain AG1-IA) TaxID=983506 RepID=L8X8Z3_THACA|nr:RhoA GTPase effector DIA/Diaphanous [Rhizoctonia solani AG-1 IA]
MDGGAPIVPVLLPAGAIHFARVGPSDTSQDIIQTLLATQGVKAEILGDLESIVGDGADWEWSLQYVRKEPRGRVWQDDELDPIIFTGILSNDFPAERLLPNRSESKPDSQRHFSAFPLTSHLHSPTVRLISQHPYLSFHVAFERVPEITDGFVMQWFIAYSSTVEDVINDIADNLGLTVYLAGTGGGKVDYVIETFTFSSNPRGSAVERLEPSASVTAVLRRLAPGRRIRLVVPEEWYRRPKSKSFSSHLSLTEDTLKTAASVDESNPSDQQEELDEIGDGTAKQSSRQSPSVPSSPVIPRPRPFSGVSNSSEPDSPSRQSTISSHRLSSIFDSWLSISPNGAITLPSQPNAAPERISVSSPLPIDPGSMRDGKKEYQNVVESEEQKTEFEEFMDEFGIKAEQRPKMRDMPWDRKRYLIEQSKSRASAAPALYNNSNASSATVGPAGAGSLVPKLLPQLTGGALGRFTVARFGSWNAATAPHGANTSFSSGEMSPKSPKGSIKRQMSFGSRRTSLEPTAEEISGLASPPRSPPLSPKASLWASWWGTPGQPVTAEGERSSDKGKSAVAELTRLGQTAGAPHSRVNQSTVGPYIAGITGNKTNSTTLVKHLVSLRVHAATAKLDWIKEFVGPGQGMEALSALIVALVKNREKRYGHHSLAYSMTYVGHCRLQEESNTIGVHVAFGVYQVSPSPRQYGREYTLAKLILVTDWKTPSAWPVKDTYDIRSNVADLLAGISVVSEDQGHRMVLDALSDFASVNREEFRFEQLIETIRVPNITPDDVDETFWSERMPALVLLIAITASCPDLEQRIALRDELSRRGFNEIIVVCCVSKFRKRLDGYCEDKLDDEEDLRARIRKQFDQTEKEHEYWSNSESALIFERILALADDYDGVPDTILEILRSHLRILEQPTTLEHEWVPLLRRFVDSVKDITGVCPEVLDDITALSNAKLDELREQLEKLVKEARNEQGHLDKIQTLEVEISTLKSMQESPILKGSGQENMHGIVQRLVQKEKMAVRLQAELDRLRNENTKLVEASEEQDRIRRERDRAKWSAMTEEMSNSRAKVSFSVAEMETLLRDKEKLVLYLKRSMEALSSRFESGSGTNQVAAERPDGDFDAESITKHAMDELSAREQQISGLRQELNELRNKLEEAQSSLKQQTAEREFKARVPPPPPPPRRQSQPFNDSGAENESSKTSPPPPPPPPPLPPFGPAELPIASPPPPPPPPPPTVVSPAPPPPPPPPPSSTPVSSPIVSSAPPPPPPPPAPPAPPAPLLTTTAPSQVSPPPAPPPPPPPSLSPPGNGIPPSAWKISKRMSGSAAPPGKKLKPFFWDKVSSTGSVQTVWGQLGMMGGQVDLNDLEEVFSLDQAPPKPVSTSNLTKGKAQQVTTMLDITRANNVGKGPIMLKTLKLSPTAIREAILTVDDERLSAEDLVMISKQLPTTEEANRIQDFGDVGKLAEADRYFSEILRIPRLQERLSCMIYRRRLELDIIEAQPDLSILHDAAVELCTSDKLRRLLQVVLAVGNALNKATFRGGASGFKLKSLMKLKETKTAKADSECPTLLHYIARVLLRSEPSTILFVEQAPHLESAARISIQTVMSGVNSIEAGLKKTTSEVISCRKASNSPSDKFGLIMQPFIRSSAESVYSLKSLAESTQVKLVEMVSYFGETTEGPEPTRPEDVFEMVLALRLTQTDQRAALDVNATMAQAPPSVVVAVSEESVGYNYQSLLIAPLTHTQKPTPKQEIQELLSPSDAAAEGSISTVHLSAGRGDLDQAIRSLRNGRRRARQDRPLSKIFLDGGSNRRSRLFES